MDAEILLHLYQVMQRWNKSVDYILECVMDKGLKAYNDFKQPLFLYYKEPRGVARSQWMTGVASCSWEEPVPYPRETIKTNMAYFKLADIIVFEIEYGITPLEIKADHEANMQEARKKGGSAPKMNDVILEAVKQFILAKPELIKESNEYIAKRFTRKLKGQQYTKFIVNSREYEVSCEGEKITTFCNTDKKDKYHDKSIAYSTLQRTYISKAKVQAKNIVT